MILKILKLQKVEPMSFHSIQMEKWFKQLDMRHTKIDALWKNRGPVNHEKHMNGDERASQGPQALQSERILWRQCGLYMGQVVW